MTTSLTKNYVEPPPSVVYGVRQPVRVTFARQAVSTACTDIYLAYSTDILIGGHPSRHVDTVSEAFSSVPGFP